MEKLKMDAFFSGVGGIELGFEQTGYFKTVYANEFDKYARQTYESNFDIKVDPRSITEVDASEIPDCDVIVGGFPCQAFSLAGKRLGFNDARGTLFFEMLRMIKEKRPRAVFCENVPGLVGHDDGKTLKVILGALKDLGYTADYKVMNAADYGNLPQGRKRLYIVAFANEELAKKFKWPSEIPLTRNLSSVIDFNEKKDERYYYRDGKQAFFDALKKGVVRHDRVYQWRRRYVRVNKAGLIPTLTANMGTGGHNVPIILTSSGEIRKLTPKECFLAQGYPADYHLPSEVSVTRLYKQAGNSVCVPVIRRIAEQVALALEK